MYSRRLDLPQLLKKKSFFLFGPRSTGKSTLIRAQLPQAKVYDLLDARVFARLSRRPTLLEEESSAQTLVAIDEIQRAPHLLNEVHRLIARDQRRFLLTGSSARKLKRGATNLLAGRAWEARLTALTHDEIHDFDLLRYLNIGGLPHVYPSPHPFEELDAYCALYLQEEIQAEALTRNVPAFSRFLDVMALQNGEELNCQSIASDCGVSPNTVTNYIEILEDTLIGYRLPGYTKTRKRKATVRGKHYFFDLGVTHTLAHRGEVKAKSELFGRAFEHFIINEIRAHLLYARSKQPLCYWRSTSQLEVDAVVGNALAVEIKAAELVTDKHLKGLRALGEEGLVKHRVAVSLDPESRRTSDGIEIVPWQTFLQRLDRNDWGTC